MIHLDRHGRRQQINTLSMQPGTLVAFHAGTTHEVTPITHGERKVIAAWWYHTDPTTPA